MTIHGMASSRKGLEIVGSGGGNSKAIIIDGVTVYDGAYGIHVNYGVYGLVLSNCEVYGTGTAGFYIDTPYPVGVYNCRAHNNTAAGFWVDDPEIVINGCLIYSNGSYGIYLDGSYLAAITNNVIYDNGTYGIWVHTYYTTNNYRVNQLINNILWGNDTRDLHCTSQDTPFGFSRNNYWQAASACFVAHSSDIVSDTPPGFWDAANGDFRLHLWSPLINAGHGQPNSFTNIGAMKTKIPLGVWRNRRIGFYGLTNQDYGL